MDHSDEPDAANLLDSYTPPLHEEDGSSPTKNIAKPDRRESRSKLSVHSAHRKRHHHHHHRHHKHHHHHKSHHHDKTEEDSAPAELTPEQLAAEQKEKERLDWVKSYVQERMSKPPTAVVQNLLHKNVERAIADFDDAPSGPSTPNVTKKLGTHGLNPADADSTAMGPTGMRSKLRSRRAQSGVRCPSCGTVGYYRINCPKCAPVTVDVVKDEWRPVTPEHVLLERARKEYDEDPQRMVEAVEFKKAASVKTTTGLGNQSWFWRKDDTVWQWDDELLPDKYDPSEAGLPFDIGNTNADCPDTSAVMAYFNQSSNRGVSHQNTLVPGKLKNVQDSDVKKEDVTAGASQASLASALANTMGGSYVAKPSEQDLRDREGRSDKEKFKDVNSRLSNGAYLWDADTLHQKSVASSGAGTQSLGAPSLDSTASLGLLPEGSNVNQPERTRAEQNLHHVLHRLVAVVKTELSTLVPDFARSMLQPPTNRVHKTFYTDEVFKEHKGYFKKRMVKEESMVHNHQFVGNYRPPDKLEYCFDRSFHKSAADRQKSHVKMHTEFKGRHASLHGVHDWLSVLGKNDKYATTGRAAERAALKLEKAFKDQKKWVEMQERNMQHRRERCVHLLTLLEEELLTDEKREIELMGIKGKQFYKRTRELVKERSETADRVMRIMMEYNFLPGVEIADYLTYTVELGRRCGVKGGSKYGGGGGGGGGGVKANAKGEGGEKEGGDDGGYSSSSSSSSYSSSGSGSSAGSSSDSGSASEGEDGEEGGKKGKEGRRGSAGGRKGSVARRGSVLKGGKEKKERGGGGGEEEKGGGKGGKGKKEVDQKKDKKFAAKTGHMNDGMAEYGSARPSRKAMSKQTKVVKMSKAAREKMSLVKKLSMDPADPYVATYFPHLPSKKKHIQTKEAIKNFKAAGLGKGIRRGVTEDHGIIPALLPLPDCYATGPVNQEAEKSYLAAKIMDDLRAKQVDGNTGGVVKEAVPLFHRVTMDEGETYSALVGRPFYYIDPRKTDVAKKNAGKMAKTHQ